MKCYSDPILLDETHEPALRSWVESANSPDADFCIQNLPVGVFLCPGGARVGIAIGDSILDVAQALDLGLFTGSAAQAAARCRCGRLNEIMALGRPHASALRLELSRLLRVGAARQPDTARCLVAMRDAKMRVPAQVGNFTDFYTSIHHATRAGRMFRPDNPLMPNFKHLPVAYHGRASSISVSGTLLRRPMGQSMAKDAVMPGFGPSRRLDFELELGFYIGPGNELGEPISLTEAEERIFGLCLVNDWSARDIQAWEYQPLGPFLGKSFMTTVSPWVVTLDALAPFRVAAAARGEDAPPLLPHLHSAEDRQWGGFDIVPEVLLQTDSMREKSLPPQRIGRARFADQYWTIFQMLAHHASNGCNLLPGDLIASGTVSGPNEGESGSLLEMTAGGARPIALPGGEQRSFLEDGDEIVMRARCSRQGYASIGFGECTGRVAPAPD